MLNPLLKLIVKQVEDNSVTLEQYVKSTEWAWIRYENRMHIDDAFDGLQAALSTVKSIISEIM